MTCYYAIYDNSSPKAISERIEDIKDIVLVYINKRAGLGECTQFEYIFYK